MPMFVTTPRNESVLRKYGAYRGRLNVLNRKQTAVQRQLRRAGLAGYEPVTQATLLALVEISAKPARFFDVGAHIGLYSTLISTIFPSDIVEVRAFEPTPETAKIARKLAEANRAFYLIERCAISSHDGRATLFISDKAETSNSLAAGFRESHEAFEVQTLRLDSYCALNNAAPTVLKIDVETHESHVLSGALQVLEHARPAVVCELLPSADAARTADALRSVVELGYTIYNWHAASGWTPTPLGEVLSSTSPEQRDWLFLPGPLPADLPRAIHEWLQAISHCTRDTNLLIDQGTPPPPGWAAPHAVWSASA